MNNLFLFPQILTSPNMKVRRLGYFCLLLNEIEGVLKYRDLVKLLIEINEKYRGYLAEYMREIGKPRMYKSKYGYVFSGEISRSIRNAENYLDTSIELGLLAPLGTAYREGLIVKIPRKLKLAPSKLGFILKRLPKTDNPFKLSTYQKFFLLKRLLYSDYDTLKALFEAKKTSKGKQLAYIFQQKLFVRLKEKLSVGNVRLKEAMYLKDRLNIIKEKWRKPEKYFEHIKASREGWLIDLLGKDYEDKIRIFLSEMFIGYDWRNTNYPKIFANAFEENLPTTILFNELSISMQKKKIMEKLSEAFRIFPSSINRISASQFFEYAQCILLCREGIIATYNDIENILTKTKDKYIFRKTADKDDIGYVSLRE
ncbi:MAG: hypothetical protein ACTSVB_08515 [Candidatus Heimdallarchaeaceae archaeon]